VDDAAILESISRVLRGDTSAFEAVVRAYQSQVVRICRAVLRNPDDAEDAAQEVFCRAFRLLPSFRLDKRFGPWITTVALNTSKSYRKKLGNTSDRRSGREPENMQSPSNPEGEVDRTILGEKVLAAVRRLPERLRETVILYYLEELDVSDVAEALGLSKENVKSRLHRARGVLRGFLEKDATEG